MKEVRQVQSKKEQESMFVPPFLFKENTLDKPPGEDADRLEEAELSTFENELGILVDAEEIEERTQAR